MWGNRFESSTNSIRQLLQQTNFCLLKALSIDHILSIGLSKFEGCFTNCFIHALSATEVLYSSSVLRIFSLLSAGLLLRRWVLVSMEPVSFDYFLRLYTSSWLAERLSATSVALCVFSNAWIRSFLASLCSIWIDSLTQSYTFCQVVTLFLEIAISCMLNEREQVRACLPLVICVRMDWRPVFELRFRILNPGEIPISSFGKQYSRIMKKWEAIQRKKNWTENESLSGRRDLADNVLIGRTKELRFPLVGWTCWIWEVCCRRKLGKTMVTQKTCPLAYQNFCKWHWCITSDADFIYILSVNATNGSSVR